MWFQANGLRNHAQAVALWKEPRYLAAARDIERFLLKLQSPEGGFYTSQDADVDATLPGKSFYALSAEARAKLGREPRIELLQGLQYTHEIIVRPRGLSETRLGCSVLLFEALTLRYLLLYLSVLQA